VEEWRSEDGSLTDEQLKERLQGLSESQKTFLRLIEGYENWLEFSTRAQSALHRIVQDHAGKTIVLVTHGGVIQVSFEYFFAFGQAIWERASLGMNYASITHWVQPENSTKWVLERFNDAGHL
jgi:probable phosphoglycerate mutase